MGNAKISQYLVARVADNKAISLTALHTNARIKLFGSTMPMSAQRTDEFSSPSQLIVYPEQGKDGIVAIAVAIVSEDRKGYQRSQYVTAFLRVSWKQKGEQAYPFIDLDESWVPADRIGQVTHEGVEVMLKNGRRFSSRDNFKYDVNKGKDLPRFVPDGDLLCRYLWGTAHAADVLHAAVQEKVKSLEPTAVKRVEQLTGELRQLKNEKKARETELLALNLDMLKLCGQREDEYQALVGDLARSKSFCRLLKLIPFAHFKGFISAVERAGF